MTGLLSKSIAALAFSASLLASAGAFALGLDPAFDGITAPTPDHAKGVVVWSHGRSINAEDSQSPTPVYLRALADDGWAVMRFDRLAAEDTLKDSSKRLADYATELKHKGYKQVVLAGQSFGAFLAIMAADATSDVDAVVATAPAAYGNFDDFYDSWRLNATKLYPLLDQVKHARVMLFYFHGDDFDPGGRGERSRAILASRNMGYAVIDQPAFMTGHWASSTGVFLRRYGACIRDFVNDSSLNSELLCNPQWGTRPSADLKLPTELAEPKTAHQQTAAKTVAAAGPTGSGNGPDTLKAPEGMRDVWYGFYPNGREVLLGIEAAHGQDLTAVYAIGPSIDDKAPANWTRRKGKIVDDSFVFEQPGKSTLRFRPKQDGGLGATWVAVDGKTSMTAHLKPIDPLSLGSRVPALHVSAPPASPVTPATAHGDSNEAQD
ncbi:MAG: alpha/beta hydrolase [Alphaproteobacteria bacterium]|nr:alpha/beta hydrolase [Alphaproteobacteria bacterium]